MSDDWRKAAADWRDYKTVKQRIDELLARIPDYPSWETYGTRGVYDPMTGQLYTPEEYAARYYPQSVPSLQGEVESADLIEFLTDLALMATPASMLGKLSLSGLLSGTKPAISRALDMMTELARSQRGSISLKPTPHKGLNVKAVLGDDLLRRIATEGYNEDIRKEILSRLAFTEARKELIDKVTPHIEKVAKEAGKGTRGYLYGSVVSTKPVLGDITVGKKGDVDLAIIDPKVAMRDTSELIRAAKEALPSGLQTIIFGGAGAHRPRYGKPRKSALQTAVAGMRRRYPGADMIRLWSSAPAGVGLLEYLEEVD